MTSSQARGSAALTPDPFAGRLASRVTGRVHAPTCRRARVSAAACLCARHADATACRMARRARPSWAGSTAIGTIPISTVCRPRSAASQDLACSGPIPRDRTWLCGLPRRHHCDQSRSGHADCPGSCFRFPPSSIGRWCGRSLTPAHSGWQKLLQRAAVLMPGRRVMIEKFVDRKAADARAGADRARIDTWGEKPRGQFTLAEIFQHKPASRR